LTMGISWVYNGKSIKWEYLLGIHGNWHFNSRYPRWILYDVTSPWPKHFPFHWGSLGYRNLMESAWQAPLRFVAWCRQMSRVFYWGRFAASSFPMLSHDSRQPEAICRENHWSRFKNFTFLKISRNIIFTYWNPAFYVEWMFHSFSFLQIEWCKATRPPEHPTRFAVSESRPAFAWNTGSGTKQKLFRQHPVIAPLKWH
jgi:hypothetical protein